VTDAVALTAVAPGARVTVAGFGAGIAVLQLEQLMSYGLVEGRTVEVLEQRPVTVLLLDQTELALEDAVAAAIRVRPDALSAGNGRPAPRW
jgi:Fe2+ transport system protein FeoA